MGCCDSFCYLYFHKAISVCNCKSQVSNYSGTLWDSAIELNWSVLANSLWGIWITTASGESNTAPTVPPSSRQSGLLCTLWPAVPTWKTGLKSWYLGKISGVSTGTAWGSCRAGNKGKDRKEKIGCDFSDDHVTSGLPDCGLGNEKEMYWLQLRGNRCFHLSNLDNRTMVVGNKCLYIWNNYSSVL